MTAGPTPTAPTTTAPSPLADHLDALLEALDAVHPGSAAKLAPGWPEDAIRQRCVVDTFQPPEPWVRLLAWRDGSPLDTPVFRDHSMLGLEAALACKEEIDRLCQAIPELGVAAGELVPFGVCEGRFLVLWPQGDDVPVFELGQGIEPFGISLAAWVQTCTDRLRHPAYDPSTGTLGSAAEGVIWQHHNPNLADFEVGFHLDFFDDGDFDDQDVDDQGVDDQDLDDTLETSS